MRANVWLLGGVSAVFLIQAHPAAAEGDMAADAASAGLELEELIVTARRVEENLQSVPVAITAMSSETLKRQNIREIRDLSSVVPNLAVGGGNTGAGAAILTIRGQSQRDIIPTADTSVGLYIDNVAVPRAYGIRDSLVDIQRVEVLRGPQGTLYGRNTTGGAVSFFSKDPVATLGGSLRLTGGNYGLHGAQGIANFPLADGVALRVALHHEAHTGYGENVPTGTDMLRLNSTYMRGKLKAERGDFTATFVADYTRLKTGGNLVKITGLTAPTATAPLGGNATREVALELGLAPSIGALTAAHLAQAAAVLQSYVNRPGFYESYSTAPLNSAGQGNSAVLNLEWKASDALTLRSISGFRYFLSHWRSDNDGTPFAISETDQRNKSSFYSQELQLLGEFGRLSWVVGGYYSAEDAKSLESSINLRIVSNLRNTTDGIVSNDSKAIFGQANWSVTDALTITVGGRLTKEKRSLIDSNRNSLVGCTVAAAVRDDGVTCVATLRASFSRPTWLLSADYKLTPDVLAYGKVSRGFRGGGLNLRASGANLGIYQPFAPETVTEYEVGLKATLLQQRLRTNVALFYDDYTNVQRNVLTIVGGAPLTLVTNATKSRLKGGEGEATWRVSEELALSAGVGYLDAKYLSFVDLTGDRTGEPWPAPQWNYSLGARFAKPTDFGSVSLDVNWAWQDDLSLTPNAVAQGQVLQKAYGLLNGRVTLAFEDHDAEIALFGRNLLNEKFYISSIGFEAAGFNVLHTGEPRIYGVQFTKRFGQID